MSRRFNPQPKPGLEYFERHNLIQSKPYTCGPTALAFLLEVDPSTLDHIADPENGTSHTTIMDYLTSIGVEYEEYSSGVILPGMLVNFWDGEDGHYGVIVKVHQDGVLLYDPTSPYYVFHTLEDFMRNWYSPRYTPAKWGLVLSS